jgi:hypothetical protein
MTGSIRRRNAAQFVGAMVLVAAPIHAAPAKTLIDYFEPTPITCALTSKTWGSASVLPRDTCNGLEDSSNTQWQYWDGKILVGADGKYRLYAGEWPQNKGFADWPNSTIVEAVSSSLMGPYVPSTTTPFTGKEQNVTGIVLNSGSAALLDSPGKIYESATLTDPWTSAGTLTVTANGSTISTATTENQSIWQNADGSFLIISRTFQDMVSPTNILGPYLIQTTIPNLQSQGYEDPVVWCSGGQYHLIANMYNARKAMHFTSVDGIHNWTNQGLAYDPTSDFVRYTDGTVNHWYKIERPGVFMQGGHVTAFTFAVIDVDKTLDLANDTHGTKIIVVPFDGVSFDHDNPGPGSAACPIDAGGAGGSGGSGGVSGSAGSGGTAGRGGGASSSGGSGDLSGAAGTSSIGGLGGGNGTQGSAGASGLGGSSGAQGGSGGSGGGGLAGAGGPVGVAGTSTALGGQSATDGGGTGVNSKDTKDDFGCSCNLAGAAADRGPAEPRWLVLGLALFVLRKRSKVS